jgi:hypothetical protein
MGNCVGIGTHSRQCVDLRGWRKQALYEPTNTWLVMKQIEVEEAVQEPISALRMAGSVFPSCGGDGKLFDRNLPESSGIRR